MRQLAVTPVFSKGPVLFLLFSCLACLHVKAQSEWKTNKDGHLKYEYKPGPGYIPPTKSTTNSPGTPTGGKTKLQLAEAKYNWTGYLYGNRERVMKNSRYGYIDGNGVEVIQLIYTDAEDFSEGLAAVKKDGAWGYINEYGSTVFEFEYSSAGSFKGGKAQVTEDGVSKEINRYEKAKVENITGKVPALVFHEGLACVKVNGKWGFQDEAGAMILPAIYDWTLPFERGLGAVCLGGLWGFVDKQGKLVIPIRYTGFAFLDTKENLLKVKTKTRYGVINYKGITVMPFIYDGIFATIDGKLINLELNGKWGCANAKGMIIIPVKYDLPFDFHGGYSVIYSNIKQGLVNENGKIVTPIIYESIQRDASGISGKLKGKTVEIKLPIIAGSK